MSYGYHLTSNLPPDVDRESGGGERLIPALLALLASLALMVGGFILLRDLQTQENSTFPPLAIAALAMWGVGGMILLFITTYQFVERLPKLWPARLEPWVFVGADNARP